MGNEKICLGIDLGTTKAAAVIYDTEGGRLLDSASADTKADSPAQKGSHEQCPHAILDAVKSLVSSLGPELKRKVSAIGVTGQMHGVLLSDAAGKLSRLATWKDARASHDGSLASIQNHPGCSGLKDGFGLTTLAWLAASGGLHGWTQACTIHDLLVARLCGLKRFVSDSADAASWGLFNVMDGKWSLDAIESLGISPSLLPEVLPPGAKAGELRKDWASVLGLAEGIPVAVATGDNQASILATAKDPEKEIFLTVGTGMQLSAIVDAGDIIGKPAPSSVEFRPFFDSRLLAVAAPLCGGQSFAWLIRSIASSMKELGIEPPSENELYRRIDSLAMSAKASGISVKPTFLGERHDPSLRASVSGLALDNFSLASLAASLADGMMLNARSMMPEWMFEGRTKLVASGNAMRRLEVLKAKAVEVFKAPLELPDSKEEAACGAAIASSRLIVG